MCHFTWLDLLPYRKNKVGLAKGKLSPPMRQYIRQSKLSTTKAEKANNETVPKKAKQLLYMEQSCHAPFGCFIIT